MYPYATTLCLWSEIIISILFWALFTGLFLMKRCHSLKTDSIFKLWTNMQVVQTVNIHKAHKVLFEKRTSHCYFGGGYHISQHVATSKLRCLQCWPSSAHWLCHQCQNWGSEQQSKTPHDEQDGLQSHETESFKKHWQKVAGMKWTMKKSVGDKRGPNKKSGDKMGHDKKWQGYLIRQWVAMRTWRAVGAEKGLPKPNTMEAQTTGSKQDRRSMTSKYTSQHTVKHTFFPPGIHPIQLSSSSLLCLTDLLLWTPCTAPLPPSQKASW